MAIFEKRTLIEAVRQKEVPKTFLKDTFFNRKKTHLTLAVEIDLVKGNRKVAPFVHPVEGGKVIANRGYETNTYRPPLVAPEKIIRAEDLYYRSPGENPYETKSPEERQAEKAAEYLDEMDESITRREELMCSQAIFEGKVFVKGDGVDEVIDFGFTNKITALTKWDQAGADPLEDLEAAVQEVQKKGFINPGYCIMASDVANAFINNEKVQKILDNRNIELAKISPKQLPSGATWLGNIPKLDLDVYSYNAYYTDDWTDPSTPAEKAMVPTGKLALLPRDAEYLMVYGAVEVIDEDAEIVSLAEGVRVPDVYTLRKPARKIMNLSSRPLPIPQKVDSWAVLTVL